MRLFGVETDGPFRVIGALAFLGAAWMVYAVARRLWLSRAAALCCAAFFAVHPFNSWFYFQGIFVSTPLAIIAAAAVWLVYDRALDAGGPRPAVSGALLFFLVYFSAACKDPGVLMVGVLLPLAAFSKRSSLRTRWFLWALSLAAALLFIWQRTWVLQPYSNFSRVDIPYALEHSGWLILNYLWLFLTASNFTYAVTVAEGPGWPMTIAVLAVFFRVLWGLRHRPVECVLFWSMGVFASECVLASFSSFWILPTRFAFFTAVAFLFGGQLWQGLSARFSRPMRLVAQTGIISALVWFFLMSALHVFASFNEKTFYRFHNSRLYSWKLLYVEGSVHEASGEWVLAEDAYRKSLALLKTPSTYNRLGVVLNRQGRWAESAVHSLEALRLNPWHVPVTENLAEALENKPDLLGQGEFWRLADSWLPERATVYNNLGALLAKKGSTGPARVLFEKALQADPASAPARHNLDLLGVSG